MNFVLAQVNIGRILAPMDSPVMADFVANLDPVNILAEESPGFLWRLKDEDNNATAIRIYDDDFLIVNMSVWKDVESLNKYVYHSMHVEIFKRRREWFEKMKEMHMALWYVPEGYFPTVEDATERLNHIRAHGDTPYAFGFRRPFSAEEAQAFEAEQKVRKLASPD